MTTVDLGKPDFGVALQQHEAYCRALESCGLELLRLPPDLDHPDSTFVEDTAILSSRCAVLCLPGAPSRVGEVESLREPLRSHYSTVYEIEPPGTVDGGDICEAGSHFFLGISNRTNEEGVRQLSQFLAAQGFTSSTVDVRGVPAILHLKSGIAYLDHSDLVVMENLADREEFAGYNVVPVCDDETYACNCVLVNDRVLVPEGFPRITAELDRRGYRTWTLQMSEFRKMDGGLSCLSLRF